MKTFNKILVNNLLAILSNNFIWFALTFWVYVETKSVIPSAVFNAAFVIITSFISFWLGSIVDHHKKKPIMLISSLISITCYISAYIFYLSNPEGIFSDLNQYPLWFLMGLILVGILAGNIRNIITPTAVTLLVPVDKHDKMNGLSGMIMGIGGSCAGILSGLILATGNMNEVLVTTILLTSITILHLGTVSIHEENNQPKSTEPKKVDILGTIKAIKLIPGLFALIFFTTFNNLLGGVYLVLIDPYGLELMSVKAYGIFWGVLSSGFVVGGLLITKFGLGKSPVRNLFLINSVLWINSIIFPMKSSIILFALGIIVWTILVPFIEATEQTIIQKVVPAKRQGRVFGFAQSIESAASPVTGFIIAPIAQFIAIPYMTTGNGVNTIGTWFGTGPDRGMALIFIAAAIIGLIVTNICRYSNQFKKLEKHFQE
jgi:DHA3 family multidrug efflux protein-like MFS transporter